MEHAQIKKEGIIDKYISGRLSDAEVQAFETHYQNCFECQKELHRLLDTQDFAGRFVLGALSAGEAAFFEKHYFMCSTCFAEVRQTEKLRLHITDSVQRRSFPLFQPHKQSLIIPDIVQKIKNIFSSPYIAFASLLLVLALLYPAWRGLRLSEQTGKPQALLGPGFSLQSSAETTRGGEARVIMLKQNEKLFLLNFTLPVEVHPQNIYHARILNSRNRLIWDVGRVWPGGAYHTFSIVCFRDSFKEGSYRLLVTELNPVSNVTMHKFSYPFRLQIKK